MRRKHGPAETLYKRWSEMGVFAWIFKGPAGRSGRADGHFDQCEVSQSPSHGIEPAVEKEEYGGLIGRTTGRMNTKLHAVTDTKGRPIRFFMSAGQVSDYTGAATLLGNVPAVQSLLADRGYDAD